MRPARAAPAPPPPANPATSPNAPSPRSAGARRRSQARERSSSPTRNSGISPGARMTRRVTSPGDSRAEGPRRLGRSPPARGVGGLGGRRGGGGGGRVGGGGGGGGGGWRVGGVDARRNQPCLPGARLRVQSLVVGQRRRATPVLDHDQRGGLGHRGRGDDRRQNRDGDGRGDGMVFHGRFLLAVASSRASPSTRARCWPTLWR